MNLERINGDVRDIGSPPDTQIESTPEAGVDSTSQTHSNCLITVEEWRNMLNAVRPLPKLRGTVILLAFRLCVGKPDYAVSAQDLLAIKKTKTDTVLTLQEIVQEINLRFRGHNRTTPFTIYRVPPRGAPQSYVLARWKSGPMRQRTRIIHTNQQLEVNLEATEIIVAEPASAPHPESIHIAEETIHPSAGTDSSDLSDADWKHVESLVIAHASTWKWYCLIEAICHAKPRSVSLATLDHIAHEHGYERKYVWGSPIDRLNICLKDHGCAFRIMKVPRQRHANCKGTHNVYEGDVTLYRIT